MASIEHLAELASTGLLAADPNIFSHISSAMQGQSRVLLCTMIAATYARKARNCTKKAACCTRSCTESRNYV